MQRFSKIALSLFLATAAAMSFAAGEVKLLKVESVVDGHYGLNAQNPRFDVLVANLSPVKQVFVHLKKYDGSWVDVPLSYSRPADNNREVWTGQFFNLNANGSVAPAWDPEFAIKYVVNGQTYWDNNGGANYSIGRNSGTTLFEGKVVYDGYYRPTSYKTATFNGWATVKNLAFAKDVKVVYSTDNWATTKTATAAFSSQFWLFEPYNGIRSNAANPNAGGFEEWSYALQVNNAAQVKYAIRYTVGGQTYWDNNFGQNYTVNFQ